MPAAQPLASCRYLGADARVTTCRGDLPMARVAVGDFVLAGDGGWAQVSHTRRVMHKGALVHASLAGGGRVRATRGLPVAVGPGHFADAQRLRVGQTVLVPVVRVPEAPSATQAGREGSLAWLETVCSTQGRRTHLRTPWGSFVAEVAPRPAQGPGDVVAAPTLAGRYRITPAGLLRLAPATARSRRTALSEALGRHSEAVWTAAFPPAPVLFHRLSAPPPAAGALVCEQSLFCCRDGDRIDFGVEARGRPLAGQGRALPRQVASYGIANHCGWVYALSLAGADTFIVSGVVAMHYPQAAPAAQEADIEGC